GCLGFATNKVLSICRSGDRFLFRPSNRDCARGATQSSLSPRCSTPISIFCPCMVCGNIARSVLNAGVRRRVRHLQFIRTACWRDGLCETRVGRNESRPRFTKINICPGPLACLYSRKLKHDRSAVMHYVTRFAYFPMGLICPTCATALRKLR